MVKKIILSFSVFVVCTYSILVFAESLKTSSPELYWSGFYIGSQAGYWGSKNNRITTTGSSTYINPAFAVGAGSISDALTQVATNEFSLHSYGFKGGALVGYNYQYTKNILLGLDIDFDGLSNTNNTNTLEKTVNLADFNENYAASLSIKQKINYLGTVRPRIGYLYYPNLLFYMTGGFAYGKVELDTTWTAQESLGPTVFSAIDTQNNSSQTLTGWTAGIGVEWLFKSNWSARLEYAYYDLNDMNATATLAQTNESTTPPALWASVAANTNLAVSVWSIKAGISYHFSTEQTKTWFSSMSHFFGKS